MRNSARGRKDGCLDTGVTFSSSRNHPQSSALEAKRVMLKRRVLSAVTNKDVMGWQIIPSAIKHASGKGLFERTRMNERAARAAA